MPRARVQNWSSKLAKQAQFAAKLCTAEALGSMGVILLDRLQVYIFVFIYI